MSDEKLRAVNAAIAENYDAVPYVPMPEPKLDVDRVCGVAAVFGDVRAPVDVLDLGCGGGVHLARSAAHASGALVGTDISAIHCHKAEERLQPFGARARIECADLLDLDVGRLGQFDFIYSVGIIYVVPPEVQRHLLSLIGQCLRPGGVALISYYSGSIPSIRANLHRVLRSTAVGLPRSEAYQVTRRRLAELAEWIDDRPSLEPMRAAVATTQSLAPASFFNEVLNNSFETISTSWLESELSEFGVHFAGHLAPVVTEGIMDAGSRAFAADCKDAALGDYRYAVFAKFDPVFSGALGDRPVTWTSSLSRPNRGELAGEQVFEAPNTQTAKVGSPRSIAMLDCMMDGPITWPEILVKVEQNLIAAGIASDAENEATMQAGLRRIWQEGLVYPSLVNSNGD